MDGVICYDKICYPNKITTPSGNYWKAIDNTYYIENEYRLSKWQSANFTNYRKNGSNWESYTCMYYDGNTSCKWITVDIKTYYNSHGWNQGCTIGNIGKSGSGDWARFHHGQLWGLSMAWDGGWEQYCTSLSMPWLYDN